MGIDVLSIGTDRRSEPKAGVEPRAKKEWYGNRGLALRPIGHEVPAISPWPQGPGLPGFGAANLGKAFTQDNAMLPVNCLCWCLRGRQ